MSGPLAGMSDRAWLRARYGYSVDDGGRLIDHGPRVRMSRADPARRAMPRVRRPRPPPRVRGPNRTQCAASWLAPYLAERGPCLSVQAKVDAAAAGFSLPTIKRAALRLGVTVTWTPGGAGVRGTVWALADQPAGGG